MPYNEEIEIRIKKCISNWVNTDQKNMFGGVCHLLNGNMFSGVYKEFLILRLGEANAEKALALQTETRTITERASGEPYSVYTAGGSQAYTGTSRVFVPPRDRAPQNVNSIGQTRLTHQSVEKKPEALALVVAQKTTSPRARAMPEKPPYQAKYTPAMVRATVEKPAAEPESGEEEVSDEATGLYLQALALHREGSLEKAKKLYESALDISPGFASALNNMGAIYMKERNFGSAIIAFQKALRIEPNNADPYYNLACLYALQRNVGQSLSYLRKAVSVDEAARSWAMKDTDLRNLRGHAEFQRIVETTRNS